METLSTSEYISKYGMDNYLNLLRMSPQVQAKGPGIFGQVGEAFKSGINQVGQGINQSGNAQNPLQLLEGSLKMGAGAVNAAFSPLAPVFKPLGDAVNAVGNKIADNPTVQKLATSKAGETISRVAEDVANLDAIAAAVVGSKTAMKAGEAVPGAIRAGVSKTGELASRATAPLKNVTKDVIPTASRILNENITQALDLNANDARVIHRSTGNDVGKFIADNNLIGENKTSTVSNLTKFFEDNYRTVREQIANVSKEYKKTQVPRYVESLKAIQRQITKVPGLQAAEVEVDNLLHKSKITLTDVQRVKELMDEHFNLYKVTGDVGEGVAKEGLANVRKDLRAFIEKEVKSNTGTDIKELNNNVSTSKGILDSVENRATRGFTRSNITLSDLGTFGVGTAFGGGNPVVGAAAVLIKKIAQSPAIRLRFAQFVDTLSDARKAKIQKALEAGKVPPELDQFK